MTTQIVATCDECGFTGRYISRRMAEARFPKHSCARHKAKAELSRRAAERESKVDRTPKPCTHQSTHEHGTYARYVLDRCRCVACTAANSRYAADLARRHAYGRAPYVDARPAQEHLERLQAAGMGWKRIAKVAGVSTGSVYPLLYGRPDRNGGKPRQRARRETVEAILAVPVPTVDALAGGALVDGVGPARRVQALMYLGWSVPQLAKRCGVDRQALDRLLSGGRTTAATATAVRKVYDALWNTPPIIETRWQQTAAVSTQRRARKAGWAPPLAWDDETIDDPAATPQHAVKTAQLGVDLDEWLYLVRCGEAGEVAARRLGVTLGAVEQAARRRERSDVLDRLAAEKAERKAARTHVISSETRKRDRRAA